MPVGWDAYQQNLISVMAQIGGDRQINPDLPMEPQLTAIRTETSNQLAQTLVNGYVAAIAQGGDTILGAPAILNPGGVATFMGGVTAALSSPPSPTSYAALGAAITAGIAACWAGAMLNALIRPPLPGHIGHFPISTVLMPGVFIMPPPLAADAQPSPTTEDFIGGIIDAMKLHCTTVSGMHPLMMLPYPAPPYPLPWMGYQ